MHNLQHKNNCLLQGITVTKREGDETKQRI